MSPLNSANGTWLIGYLLPGSDKVQTTAVAGGDAEALLSALGRIESLAGARSPAEYTLMSMRVCFEAGYDGFWLARYLIDRGIDTIILDPSSFLVSQRGRRVKTDRIDVKAMVFTLQAYLLGDRSVCRPVRLPSVAEEDAKRLSRERTQFKKERIQACETEGAINDGAKIRVLKQLDGVGEVGATHLVTEVFHQSFKNRKHLASYLGLLPSP